MRSASSNIRSIDLSHVVSGGLRMERSESSTMTLTSLSKFVGAGVPLNYGNNGCSEIASNNLVDILCRCDQIDSIINILLDHDKIQPCDLK
jgi:hypothetical protein